MIENYAEKIKHESNGFIRHNGIRIVSVDEEKSVLEAEITDNSRNVWGSVHGGFLYTMADTAAGAFARIKYGRRNVTLNGSMNYLRPTTHSKTLTAVGREIKVGGHVGFFEVNITDDTGAARAETAGLSAVPPTRGSAETAQIVTKTAHLPPPKNYPVPRFSQIPAMPSSSWCCSFCNK